MTGELTHFDAQGRARIEGDRMKSRHSAPSFSSCGSGTYMGISRARAISLSSRCISASSRLSGA